MEHITHYLPMNLVSGTYYIRMFASFAVGVLVGVFGFWMWSATGDSLAVDVAEEKDVVLSLQEEDTGSALPLQGSVSVTSFVQNERIAVPNQVAGYRVVVTRAVFDEEGWVVIHEGTDGKIGNALGAARFPAGESAGEVHVLRATVARNVYRAVLYHDNGDKVFDLQSDFPILTGGNQPILTTFTAQ